MKICNTLFHITGDKINAKAWLNSHAYPRFLKIIYLHVMIMMYLYERGTNWRLYEKAVFEWSAQTD